MLFQHVFQLVTTLSTTYLTLSASFPLTVTISVNEKANIIKQILSKRFFLDISILFQDVMYFLAIGTFYDKNNKALKLSIEVILISFGRVTIILDLSAHLL